MAATRLLMRKLRDILRLKYEAGLGHRAIARACSIGVSTVSVHLQRAVTQRSVRTRGLQRSSSFSHPTRPKVAKLKGLTSPRKMHIHIL